MTQIDKFFVIAQFGAATDACGFLGHFLYCLWLRRFHHSTVPSFLITMMPLALLCFIFSRQCLGFIPQSVKTVHPTSVLSNDRFNRDLDERSRQRAQGQGGGEMAAGAILGGLVGGPFGVLFGAQIGANFGSKNAAKKARTEEMERQGITQDMLDAAQDCGVALEQSMEGLQASEASLDTQQRLARRLDRDSVELYEKAKDAITAGDEEAARTYLLKRTGMQDKLKSVLKLCAEEKKRLGIMKENISAIEQRALEVESILQRTVSSKTIMNASTSSDFAVPVDDPLLKKFRDLGID
jgi:hypothetical protein